MKLVHIRVFPPCRKTLPAAQAACGASRPRRSRHDAMAQSPLTA
jgi:hypothetical protein